MGYGQDDTLTGLPFPGDDTDDEGGYDIESDDPTGADSGRV